MNKIFNFIKNNYYFIIYSLIELILAILLVIKEEIFNDVNYVYYSFILLNFIFSFILLLNYKNKDNLFFCIAYLFAIFADFNLIILGDNLSLGVFFFLCCQLFYMLMIGINKTQLLIRLIIIVILELLAIIITKSNYSFLVFITIVYFSTFLANIIFAFINKINIIFIIGMILFILCDVCVGISNFEMFAGEIANILGRLIYYFYLPGLYLMSAGMYIKSKSEVI